MWTLENMPPKAAKHLPDPVGPLFNRGAAVSARRCRFRKARGVAAIGVYDRYANHLGIYFCNGKQILHREHGYGYTPYELATPEDSFSSVCFPTLKDAVQYIKDNYWS